MRVRTVACSLLLVAASVGGAKTLAAASPDCARWIKEYQQGLTRRAVLGKKHVVKAAHHLIVPRPRLERASMPPSRVRPPKLSPAEMLKRFKVLCGEDLPDEILPVAFVPTGLEDTLIPATDVPDDDTIATLTGTGSPSPFTPNTPTNTGTTAPAATPPYSGGTGALPSTPILPGTLTPVVPSPVPEPGTLVLLLTGIGTLPVFWRVRCKTQTA